MAPPTHPADPFTGQLDARWLTVAPHGEPRAPRHLGRQIGTVLADQPLFLAAPVLRHWRRRWGATPRGAN